MLVLLFALVLVLLFTAFGAALFALTVVAAASTPFATFFDALFFTLGASTFPSAAASDTLGGDTAGATGVAVESVLVERFFAGI
jgi:hypothetical protein